MMSKIGGYLGIARKANYLVVGSDNLKFYSKKMYLIVLSNEYSENVKKIALNKASQLGIKVVVFNGEISDFIGVENCKIVGIRNKGISDAILKCESEFTIL